VNPPLPLLPLLPVAIADVAKKNQRTNYQSLKETRLINLMLWITMKSQRQKKRNDEDFKIENRKRLASLGKYRDVGGTTKIPLQHGNSGKRTN